MTNSNRESARPKRQERRTRNRTIVKWLLFVGAFGALLAGFILAPNLSIDPIIVTIALIVSSILFGILSVLNLIEKDMRSRVLGVVTVVAAILAMIFAIAANQLLGQIVDIESLQDEAFPQVEPPIRP
ncbi:MAG: hypothetical protein GYB68_17925 [Chloroflexi bacterium]|nr:hypothetical protein [Chloroflexota bacterium]